MRHSAAGVPVQAVGAKLLVDNRLVHGVLSTDRAASSYGQLVLVLDDGRALAPEDIYAADVVEASVKELQWCLETYCL
jgi:hypothetical protein